MCAWVMLRSFISSSINFWTFYWQVVLGGCTGQLLLDRARCVYIHVTIPLLTLPPYDSPPLILLPSTLQKQNSSRCTTPWNPPPNRVPFPSKSLHLKQMIYDLGVGDCKARSFLKCSYLRRLLQSMDGAGSCDDGWRRISCWYVLEYN